MKFSKISASLRKKEQLILLVFLKNRLSSGIRNRDKSTFITYHLKFPLLVNKLKKLSQRSFISALALRIT